MIAKPRVTGGMVRRRSTLRLSPADVEQGYALACQTVIEGDVAIYVPPQEKIERRLTTDRIVAEVTVPEEYDYSQVQTVRRIHLALTPPSMDDQIDDWSRLQTAFRLQHRFENVTCSLRLLQRMGDILRAGQWKVTAVVDVANVIENSRSERSIRVIDLQPGLLDEYSPLWGAAIDR